MTTPPQEDILRKIQGLLAKAERTDNDHEADAFFAKANEMMRKHAIDLAQLRASGPGAPSTIVFEEWMYASNDYNARGRASILAVAAQANRCRVLLYQLPAKAMKYHHPGANATSKWCQLVGFPDDVEYVKLLYTSLFAQGIKSGRREARSRGLSMKSGAYAFVTSYLVGYSATIAARLSEYMNPPDPTGQALIRNIESEVDAAVAKKYGRLKAGKSKRLSNSDGYYQGASDGRTADLAAPGRARIG